MVEYDFIGNKTFYFLEDQQFRIYKQDVWVIQLIYSLWKKGWKLVIYFKHECMGFFIRQKEFSFLWR